MAMQKRVYAQRDEDDEEDEDEDEKEDECEDEYEYDNEYEYELNKLPEESRSIFKQLSPSFGITELSTVKPPNFKSLFSFFKGFKKVSSK